ncbi:MAG TPA: glycosyltransferase family 2 protein [Candidatus Limnocylindrales bacterium]|nr:glycosyltransferase family 2 protein [Candidatus Limnocylindrales bacterium]
MTDRPIPPLPREPTVTLVVAMRNEEAAIERCIRSLLGQNYPAGRLEILVYDGESGDRSPTIAEGLLAGRHLSAVRRNPRRTQASSWNLGIAAAVGDVIGIVSGHGILDVDYVSAAVECLARTGADMVGGPVRAIGSGAVGEAIALAVSTPFGVGGARFRYLDREERVDTVFMGVCRAETYRRYRFDETMARNQDDELSYRILDDGGTIICSPQIRSTYLARASLGTLWTQYQDYGHWKVRVAELHPSQVRFRHVAPSVFVGGLTALAAASLVWRPAALGLVAALASYGAAMAVQIAAIRRRAGAPTLACLPIVFVVLHASYGLGFLRGLLEHPVRAKTLVAEVSRSILGRVRR